MTWTTRPGCSSRRAARLEPFEHAGQPEEHWDKTIEATDALRPIASEALLALFKQRMTTEVERTFGRVLEQQSKRAG
ncbi:MAG: hypothetical protein WA484_10760 [Solirubrobacteraceae bacterium]